MYRRDITVQEVGVQCPYIVIGNARVGRVRHGRVQGAAVRRDAVADADMVRDARQMASALRARDYPSLRLTLDVLNDEDHLSVAPRGLTHGLKQLLGTAPVR